MEKTITVSVSDLRKGYGLACREWKDKIKAKFPSVIEASTKCYKVGDRITIHGKSVRTYECLLSRVGDGKVALIVLQDGNLWADGVQVDNYAMVSLQDMRRITAGFEATLTDTGERIGIIPKDEVDEYVNVEIDFIKEAYEAANETTKKWIEGVCPEIVKGKYLRLIEDPYKYLTIGTTPKEIDGVGMFIGYGSAPTPELKLSCLMVNKHSVEEVEVTEHDSYFVIAFKKK